MKTDTALAELPVRHKSDPCCEPAAPAQLTTGQTVKLAARLKAVGDPTRLAMLDLLAQQEAPLCVCDLTPRFAQNQPTISHHLRLLREVGLIDTEKRGIWAYYWATDQGRNMLSALSSFA